MLDQQTIGSLLSLKKALKEVGDRLSAIDHDLGKPADHWKAIGELGAQVREIALHLPENVQAQMPQLMDFTQNPNYGIAHWWGGCEDEVIKLLK